MQIFDSKTTSLVAALSNMNLKAWLSTVLMIVRNNHVNMLERPAVAAATAVIAAAAVTALAVAAFVCCCCCCLARTVAAAAAAAALLSKAAASLATTKLHLIVAYQAATSLTFAMIFRRPSSV